MLQIYDFVYLSRGQLLQKVSGCRHFFCEYLSVSMVSGFEKKTHKDSSSRTNRPFSKMAATDLNELELN